MVQSFITHKSLIQISLEVAGFVITFFTFYFPIIGYINAKKFEKSEKQFQNYHQLIDTLVGKDQTPMLDRQIAIVFELRHYTKYHSVTKRILYGLKDQWNLPQYKRLIDEIDFTLQFISRNKLQRILSIN